MILLALFVAAPDAGARLSFIEDHFEATSPAARDWWAGWIAGYSGLTAGAGILAAASEERADQISFTVNAAASAVGLVPLLAFPLPPRTADEELRAHFADPIELRLALAERLLVESAEAEAFGRSWIAHLAAVAVNLAAGLILIAYDDFDGAAIAFGGGVAVAELQIWTQPTAAIDALDAYRTYFGGLAF